MADNVENKPNRPDYERPEYKAGKPARRLCAALMEGTDGVRALGQDGLPQWPAEKEKFYKIRSTIAQVTRYYERTVQAAVGMICSTPPSLAEDANELIAADAEDIDGRGTHLEVFAKNAAEEAINGGFVAIFVEAPPVDLSTMTHEDEIALGLRPFWVQVPADRIISWVVEVPNWAQLVKDYAAGILTSDQVKGYAKQTIVRQVVIYEPTDVPASDFGTKTVDRYRVLRLTDLGVTFQVWERVKAEGATGEHFQAKESGAHMMAKQQPFREIPLAVVYAGKKLAPFVARLPLHGLAELNLAHYQVTADRLYLMKLCHSPTFTTMGFEDDTDETGQKKTAEVGPNSWLKLPLNGDAKYTAADPNALTSSKEEKEDLVRQMATLGMAFLGKDRSMQSETATARALDDAAENATHATVARGLQDGLEQALKFHAQYRGVDAPSMKVNTSYASPTVDPQIVGTLWQAVVAGDLDMESFIHFVQSGTLPDDIEARLQLQKITKAMNADLNTEPTDSPPITKAA